MLRLFSPELVMFPDFEFRTALVTSILLFNKQTILLKLYGLDVSYWTWVQRHHREQHFWFLSRFTTPCRLGGTVKPTLHFMTNPNDFNFHITNSPFLSSRIPFLLRPPISFLYNNLYDTHGHASRINVLFWTPRDYSKRYSHMDKSWGALLRKFHDLYGFYLNNIKFSSHDC